MKQDEIIEMARDAGLDWHKGWTLEDGEPNRFEAFAKLVAAKERETWPDEMEAMERQVNILTDELAKAVKTEREACAKICDELAGILFCHADRDGADICASLRDTIRSRGES